MISVREAKNLISKHITLLGEKEIPVQQAAGYVLADKISAPSDTPPFDQSAMDGYAFLFDGNQENTEMIIVGEVQAGTCFNQAVLPGQAVRIFTGAPLPKNTDTVVMQEKAEVRDNRLILKDPSLKAGSNVRLKGSQNLKGETVLKAGHVLTAPSLSFIAGMGIDRLKVYRKPVIRVLVTGKELARPGTVLNPGEIYESNSVGISAALLLSGFDFPLCETVDDQENLITDAIQRLLHADILLITGGVSVGDYDFVAKSLEECGVRKVFHKVRQKPGKPLFFGVKDQTLVFGLPGNPASVMTCLYVYVLPAILQMTGQLPPNPEYLPMNGNYKKPPSMAHFLKGKIHGSAVEILPGQESYLMNYFAAANCLILVDEEKETVDRGDQVQVIRIK